MATKVASITVAGLKTISEWVDHFVVEVYSDVNLTQLVDTKTSSVTWDGTHNNQKDLILFNGLVFGQDYWLRAGVVAPESGITTWSASYEVQAGESTAPDCTYSGTYTATSSGVAYDVTAAGVPSDIDHFEAIWTYDGSVPAESVKPYWSGRLTDSTFAFFAGGSDGQTVTSYVRAVNTSKLVQSWVSLGQQTVASGILTGNFTGTIAGIPASDISTAAITGVNKNMLPDSDFKFGDAYWQAAPGATPLVWEPMGGYNGGGAFVYTGTGGEQGLTAEMDAWDFLNKHATYFTVVPGQTYSLSCYITSSAQGGASINIFSTDRKTTYLSVPGVQSQGARYGNQWTCPDGVTQVCVGLFLSAPGALPQGSITSFSAPQLEVGTFVTAYKSNSMDDGSGTIPLTILPATFVGTWSATASYGENEQVFYQGNYWLSLGANTDSPPSTTNPLWQLVGPTPATILAGFDNQVPEWNAYTAYVPYQEVQYNGAYWVCVSQNSNQVPQTGSLYWEQVGASTTPTQPVQPWDSTTAYNVNDEVTYSASLSGSGNVTASPTTVTQVARQNVWINPNNALGNSAYATATLYGSNNSVNASYLLQFSGFNFSSIPAGAAITGIVATWKRGQTGGTSAVYDDEVVILGLSGATTNHVKPYPSGEWPSTPTAVQYGTSTDLWGQMPTLAQIQSNSLILQIGCQCTLSPGTGADVELNDVTLTVYYATSGQGATNYYVCLVGNTDKEPDTNPSYWQLVGPATQDGLPDGTAYKRTAQGSSHENLVENPTFLSGTTAGWTCSGGTMSIVTDTLPSGQTGQCIKMSCTNEFQELFSNHWAFTPGSTYTYTAWVKTGGVASWFWYGGPNNTLQQGFGAPTGWTQITAQWTVPVSNPNTLTGWVQFLYFNSGVSDWVEVWGASCVKVRSLDDEVSDGSTYQRTLGSALTNGQVDLSKTGVISKTLGYVSDAPGRAAVVNMFGGNAVSAVDGANRALINAASSGHENLNQDYIGDGNNYNRISSAFVDSGCPYTLGSAGNVAWTSGWAYQLGREVTYGGNYYVCIVSFVGGSSTTVPPSDPTHWQLVGPVSLQYLSDGGGRYAAIEPNSDHTVSHAVPGNATGLGEIVMTGGDTDYTTGVSVTFSYNGTGNGLVSFCAPFKFPSGDQVLIKFYLDGTLQSNYIAQWNDGNNQFNTRTATMPLRGLSSGSHKVEAYYNYSGAANSGWISIPQTLDVINVS